MALFIKGLSIDEAEEVFEKLAKVAFKPRKVLHIPFISRIYELAKSYLADGLYPAENIEAALKAVFGKDKSILDYSYATSIGARVGLPVATIREPLSCIFTNYNGVGTRDEDQGKPPQELLRSVELIRSRSSCYTAGRWLWKSTTVGNASSP
jgi:hypothetical protein